MQIEKRKKEIRNMLRESKRDFNRHEFPEFLKKLGVSLGARQFAPLRYKEKLLGGRESISGV